MNVKINNTMTITTEHPASHYGAGVLLIDGQAYGPADVWHDADFAKLAAFLHGVNAEDLTCARMIVRIVRDCRDVFGNDEIDQIKRWLQQNPTPASDEII